MPFSLSELSFPVYLFLALYGFFLLFYVIYSFFTIMHLVKYGVAGFPLYLLVVVFTSGTILLVAASIFQLLNYDWTYSVPLNGFTDTLSNPPVFGS
ncbi:MAG: hypothetical protein AAB664_02365 [Patescibacteria group bacterium]